MINYGEAKAQDSIFLSGLIDPAYDGTYKRYGPPNGPSSSFYHSAYPNGAPHQTHFTLALQGRKAADPFSHFHISVAIDGTNVGIYFNYDAARGNLRKTINWRNYSSSLQSAFNAYYDGGNGAWPTIDMMAALAFSKITNQVVTKVFDVDYRETNTYDQVETEFNEDLSGPFKALFGR